MKFKAKHFDNEKEWIEGKKHKKLERVAVWFYRHELFRLEDLTDWVSRRFS